PGSMHSSSAVTSSGKTTTSAPRARSSSSAMWSANASNESTTLNRAATAATRGTRAPLPGAPQAAAGTCSGAYERRRDAGVGRSSDSGRCSVRPGGAILVCVQCGMATVPYRGGRILLNASARGIESRPVDAVEAVPALASVLEGFRATGGRSGPLAFVHFAGRVALTGRVERSAVNPDDAWLEVQPGPLPLRLTRRELDIVSLMCVGMSYARIA